MQTLEKPGQQNRTPLVPQKKRTKIYALMGTAFFSALVVFGLINFQLLNKSGQKHQIAEVAQQAAAEQQSGVPSSHSWAWWLSKMYMEQAQAPDVVVFGSSLLGSAHISVDANFESKLLDVLTHRQMSFFQEQLSKRLGHRVCVFSLGSPGQMISDSYVLTRALFPVKKPKLVIATIAPRDFVDNTLPCPASTDHFKFFSNFLDLNAQAAAAYPDFFSRLGAEIERLPVKQTGKFRLNKFAEANESTYSNSEISRIGPGKSVVPAKAIPTMVDNTAEYKERFRNPNSANYQAEMQFFNSWLAEMRKQGIEVVVVAMPTTESNRKLLPDSFWTMFRKDVAAVCQKNNSDWFDLSDSGLFTQVDYLDTVHLNAYGGIRLFPVLAERLSLNPACVKALK